MNPPSELPEELLVTKIGDEASGFEYVVLTNRQYAKLILGLPGEEMLAARLFTPTRWVGPGYDEFVLSSSVWNDHLHNAWHCIICILHSVSSKKKSAALPYLSAEESPSSSELAKHMKTLPKRLIKHTFEPIPKLKWEEDLFTTLWPDINGASLTIAVNNSSRPLTVKPYSKHTMTLRSKSAIIFGEDFLLAYLQKDRGVGRYWHTGLLLTTLLRNEKPSRSGHVISYPNLPTRVGFPDVLR